MYILAMFSYNVEAVRLLRKENSWRVQEFIWMIYLVCEVVRGLTKHRGASIPHLCAHTGLYVRKTNRTFTT